MALEQALAEQQKQRGACGLCAPCLFPPCANITQRCPRESHLTPPQPYPIPYRSYPGNIPHSCQPYRLCQNAALFAKDPTETLPSDPTQADPHPLEILPKLKPYPKHCQTLSSHPKYPPPLPKTFPEPLPHPGDPTKTKHPHQASSPPTLGWPRQRWAGGNEDARMPTTSLSLQPLPCPPPCPPAARPCWMPRSCPSCPSATGL